MTVHLRRSGELMTVTAALVTLVVTGCGGASHHSQSGIPSVGRCRATQLVLTPGRSGVAAGSVGISIIFKNVSGSRCSLEGYPSLQMLDATGAPIRTIVHDGASVTTVPRLRVRPVELAPDGTARAYLGYSDTWGAGTARCPVSASVRITPPADHRAITIRLRLAPYGGVGRRLQCGQISVSPLTRTLNGWA